MADEKGKKNIRQKFFFGTYGAGCHHVFTIGLDPGRSDMGGQIRGGVPGTGTGTGSPKTAKEASWTTFLRPKEASYDASFGRPKSLSYDKDFGRRTASTFKPKKT